MQVCKGGGMGKGSSVKLYYEVQNSSLAGADLGNREVVAEARMGRKLAANLENPPNRSYEELV